MRLFWILLALAAAVLIPFALWGDTFDGWFTGDAALVWIREKGPFGWLAVILLLISDLVLPVPGTAVMSAAGYLWGALVGGVIASTGSFCSGLFAYGLCRKFGRGAAEKLAGAKDLERVERVFRDRGVLFVAISRSFPLLAEVIPCLAGLTRMPFREFVGALALGGLPMGFIFAYIGAIGQANEGLALGLSVAVPAVLWTGAHFWLRRQERK